MTNFDQAVMYLIVEEKGFAHVRGDSGGPTKFGITLRTLSEHLHRHATAADVRALTLDVAKQIYRERYWVPGLEDVDPRVATAILNWSALHGAVSARRNVQATCNALGSRLVIDGDLGEESIAAIRAIEPQKFLARFIEEIKLWCHRRAGTKHSQRQFLDGWIARADRLLHQV